MKKRLRITFLVFLITLFVYSAIQIFIPILHFNLNEKNLNIKSSKICSEIFKKDFDLIMTSYENKSNAEIKICFKNKLQKKSIVEVTVVKTILNQYNLIKINYIDQDGLNHSYERNIKDNYFMIIITLMIIFIFLLKLKQKLL